MDAISVAQAATLINVTIVIGQSIRTTNMCHSIDVVFSQTQLSAPPVYGGYWYFEN